MLFEHEYIAYMYNLSRSVCHEILLISMTIHFLVRRFKKSIRESALFTGRLCPCSQGARKVQSHNIPARNGEGEVMAM